MEAYPRLMHALNEVRGQWRRQKLLEGSLLLVAGVLGVLAVLVAVDNIVKPDVAGRFLLAAVLWGGLIVAILSLIVTRWLEDRRDDFFAAVVEAKHPELRNQLINALQLGRDHQPGFSKELIAAIVTDADRATIDLEMGESVDRQPAKRALCCALAALAVIGLYAGIASARFSNGLARVLLPSADIAPYTRTQIDAKAVSPGTTRVAEGEAIPFKVKVAGVVPATAQLHRRASKGPWQAIVMQPDAEGSDTFQFVVQQAGESFDYYVTAGDGRSTNFRINVVKPPQVERLTLTYDLPSYTGQQPRKLTEADGEIGGIAGTKVTYELKASKPLQNASLTLKNGDELKLDKVDERTWTTSFVLWANEAKAQPDLVGRQVLAPTTYQVRLLDTDGYTNKDGLWRNIALTRDQAPAVTILAPSDKLSLKLDATVPLAVEARDDFGLGLVRLVCRVNSEDQVRELARWPHDGAPALQATDKFEWYLAKTGLKVNDRVEYWAEVVDRNVITGPGRAESRHFFVEIINPEAIVAKLDTNIFDYAQMLEILLKMQRDNRTQTAAVGATEGQEKILAEFRKGINDRQALLERVQKIASPSADVRRRVQLLAEEVRQRVELHRAAVAAYDKKDANGLKAVLLVVRQSLIRDKSAELARAMEKDGTPLKSMVEQLDNLVVGLMAEALKLLESARTAEQEAMAAGFRTQSLPVQDKIIAELEAMLARLQKNEQAKKELRKLEKKDKDAHAKVKALLTTLVKDLDKLLKDQTELADKFERMPAKKADELKEEQLKAAKDLEELKKRTEKWAKGSVQELTKMPEGFTDDFGLRKDVNKIFEEIEKAAGKAKAEKIEVGLEDLGAGLATRMKEDLEMWLPDAADTAKWVLEEPLNKQNMKIPEMPLPKALEDLVGDLLQKADEFDEDADDITSAWGDNLDQAGWGVADGPISFFSAKGKTGNDQPNNMEATGRSGDGRRGKSTGQMVGDTARGLPGRKTPARVGQEKYEPGQLKNEGSDDPNGSTGGGKVAGGGRRGLQGGAPPPPTTKDLGRLSAKQAGIREKAEQVAKKLESAGVNASRINDSIELMKSVEKDLADHRYDDAFRKRREAMTKLRGSFSGIDQTTSSRISRARDLPPQLRNELLQSADEGYPAGYEGLLKNYYKALSTAEK